MSDKAKLANSTAFGVLLTFKNFPPCSLKLLGVPVNPVKVLEPPLEGVVHERVPLPLFVKTCPLEPCPVGKVNEAPLLRVLA